MMTTESEHPMITESERHYDIGNKGYLTKFERQLKDLDAEADVLDVKTAAGIDPHHRFSKFNSSYSGHDDEDGVVLDEAEQNYKGYLDKVQRDFKEVELEQSTSADSSSTVGIFRVDTPELQTSAGGYSWWGFSTSSSSRASSCISVRAALKLGVIMVLLVWNMVVSHMAWKAATMASKQEVSVSELGRLVSTKDGSMVSTIGTGNTFSLSVITPPKQGNDSVGDGDAEAIIQHPYACMGLEGAVELWQSTLYGAHTNVLLVHAEGGDKDDDTHRLTQKKSGHIEHGIQLTFQGATQNGTHACLPTHNPHQTLCIDFVSHRCETSPPAGDDDDDDDGVADMHHERRELFQKRLAQEAAAAAAGGHPRPRRTQEECQNALMDHDHNWCHSFVSVVLIGSSST